LCRSRKERVLDKGVRKFRDPLRRKSQRRRETKANKSPCQEGRKGEKGVFSNIVGGCGSTFGENEQRKKGGTKVRQHNNQWGISEKGGIRARGGP